MLLKNGKIATPDTTIQRGPLMSAQLDNDLPFSQHSELPQYYRSILRDFRKVVQFYGSFNILFATIILVAASLFVVFLPFLSHSAVIALALGALFLTCFSYCVLLFYFQAKKPEQFLVLREQFSQSCRQLFPYPLSLAEALSKLASHLDGFEKNFYQVPKSLQAFSGPISRFSAACYGEDVAKMKLMLLQAAVQEHLKQIRITPTDLEAHASLAGTYIALSKLYKFEETSKLAIEELRILCHYAPNDPWAHDQLAAGYRSLNQPADELREIETLLRLRPNDKEILFRLGTLYFEQGENAKGLQVYEELKRANFKKADDLIEFYGIFSQKNS